MAATKLFNTTNIAAWLIAALIGNEERRFRQWMQPDPCSAAIALPSKNTSGFQIRQTGKAAMQLPLNAELKTKNYLLTLKLYTK
jgi:hypothetical protein